MGKWSDIRGVLRDLIALGIGTYIAIRAAEPPITLEDIPAFSAAAGFIGVPFVARSGTDE